MRFSTLEGGSFKPSNMPSLVLQCQVWANFLDLFLNLQGGLGSLLFGMFQKTQFLKIENVIAKYK